MGFRIKVTVSREPYVRGPEEPGGPNRNEGRNEVERNGSFRTKPLETILVEAEDKGEGTLKRTLGVSALTLLGVGAIIGTGIFVLTGQAAGKHAGPAVVISMIVAGIVSALAALCYSEFASSGADLRFGLHVQLRHIGRVHRVDHRLGPDPRIRVRGGDGRGRMVGEYDQSSGGSRHSLPVALSSTWNRIRCG